jgi:hypothetical protein
LRLWFSSAILHDRKRRRVHLLNTPWASARPRRHRSIEAIGAHPTCPAGHPHMLRLIDRPSPPSQPVQASPAIASGASSSKLKPRWLARQPSPLSGPTASRDRTKHPPAIKDAPCSGLRCGGGAGVRRSGRSVVNPSFPLFALFPRFLSTCPVVAAPPCCHPSGGLQQEQRRRRLWQTANRCAQSQGPEGPSQALQGGWPVYNYSTIRSCGCSARLRLFALRAVCSRMCRKPKCGEYAPRMAVPYATIAHLPASAPVPCRLRWSVN